MEDESGLTETSSTVKANTNYFDELCAYYMAIGCPCEEYWRGDPTRLQHYAKAHELRNEQRNQEMWLQGLYDYRAFEAVISAFSWGLGGKKGTKPDGYIDKPIRITPLTEQEEAERAEKARQKIIADLTGWANNFNAQNK